jgi:hypothetical protein
MSHDQAEVSHHNISDFITLLVVDFGPRNVRKCIADRSHKKGEIS